MLNRHLISPHCLRFLCQLRIAKKNPTLHTKRNVLIVLAKANRETILYIHTSDNVAFTALFNTFVSNMMPRYTCKYDCCLADNKRRRGDDTSSSRIESVVPICGVGTLLLVTARYEGAVFEMVRNYFRSRKRCMNESRSKPGVSLVISQSFFKSYFRIMYCCFWYLQLFINAIKNKTNNSFG